MAGGCNSFSHKETPSAFVNTTMENNALIELCVSVSVAMLGWTKFKSIGSQAIRAEFPSGTKN